ncbi:MAG: hypothetical protein WD231_05935 [Candidatus Woykebacteria bacterium]
MSAIKISNSRGIRVINCRFEGFETDIELENVEDFLSKGNKFSSGLDPQTLLNLLAKAIRESRLPNDSKEQLFREIVEVLSLGRSKPNDKEEPVKLKLLKFVSDKAVNYFVQLAAAVSAGLIIKSS